MYLIKQLVSKQEEMQFYLEDFIEKEYKDF